MPVNINSKQLVLIVLAMLSFTATGIQQLEPVIGVTAVKVVASIATFINGLMAAAMAPFLSNANVVKDAGSVHGVEVRVGREAPQNIAALAVDDAQVNISPKSGEEVAVAQNAQVA